MLQLKRMFKTQVLCAGLLVGMSIGSGLADGKKLAVDKVEGELSIMVLGSGGPVATAKGRASAGYLIFTDGKPRILMDAGGGTFQRLAKSGTNIRDLDIVLLSHLHIDHTGDLSSMIKTIYFHNNMARTQGTATEGRTAPIHIYGPAANGTPFPGTNIPQYPDSTEYVDGYYAMPNGVERYLNIFAKAISGGASAFRYAAHDLPSQVAGATMNAVLMADDGLVVKSIAVDHGPVPSVAFRIEYKGHSIVYSGDTGTKGGRANMIALSQGADFLIYDTAVTETLPVNPVFHILHTQPGLIGEVAAAADVKKLLLSHITPVTEGRLHEVKEGIKAAGFGGKIKAAKDLQVFNLGD